MATIRHSNGEVHDEETAWTSDASITERVRRLYPKAKETRQISEDNHTPLYEAMLLIREGMIPGEHKNPYAEPIVNTINRVLQLKFRSSNLTRALFSSETRRA